MSGSQALSRTLENSVLFSAPKTCDTGTAIAKASAENEGFPDGSVSKESPAMQETLVRFLGWEDLLEKGKATHSSIAAWRILWTLYGP